MFQESHRQKHAPDRVFGLSEVVDSGRLHFIVIHGSTVSEPGVTVKMHRLHLDSDLINLSLHQVEVTTDKEGENLDHDTLAAGDVVRIDRGYNHPQTLVPFIDRGGDIEGNLHAFPLAEEKAAAARCKAKQRAKDKGLSPSVETLSLSEWVLIFTSLPPEALCTTTAFALYRVRWQVEWVIKRLKSLLNGDGLRAHQGSTLAELYLHGKLLYAAVLEKMTQSRFDWRCWHTVADDLKAGIEACFPTPARFVDDSIKSLSERPRKRTLQGLPSPILVLLNQCRESAVSRV